MDKKKAAKVLGLRQTQRRIQQVISILSERDPALLEQWLTLGERNSRKGRPKPRR